MLNLYKCNKVKLMLLKNVINTFFAVLETN